jgi:hypothetical protein
MIESARAHKTIHGIRKSSGLIFYSLLTVSIFSPILVLNAAVSGISMTPNTYGGSPPQLLTQTVQPASISERWEKKIKELNPRTKSYPDNKNHVLLDLLDKSRPEQVKMELESVRSLQTDYSKMSDYEQTLVQAFVLKFVHQKQKRQIVYLLSGKFPRYVGVVPTELFLGINSKDNILLVINSYERATNEAVRRSILEALSVVFRDLRQKYKVDQDFIEHSKQWYLSNRNRIKVNPYYEPRYYRPLTGDFFLLKKRGRA